MTGLLHEPITDAASYIRGRVDMDVKPPCWIWTGDLSSRNGYGQIKLAGRKRTGAHRASYETFIGPIPAGLVIDHLCRTPACVNPEHLEPVTQRENLRRGARATGDVCKNGHPLTGDNVILRRTPTGFGRRCITCNRTFAAAAYARLKSRRSGTE